MSALCIFLYCMGGLTMWCAATRDDWEAKWLGVSVMPFLCMLWPFLTLLWFVSIVDEEINRHLD